MIRSAALLLVAVLVGAVRPPLPVPPIPPVNPPSDQAAPVPNVDLQAPLTAASQHTSLGMHVFRMPDTSSDLAFIPGSAYDSPEDRRPVQTPGITLRVPVPYWRIP